MLAPAPSHRPLTRHRTPELIIWVMPRAGSHLCQEVGGVPLRLVRREETQNSGAPELGRSGPGALTQSCECPRESGELTV